MSPYTLQLCRVVHVYDALDDRHRPAIAIAIAIVAAAAAAAALRCNIANLIYEPHLS